MNCKFALRISPNELNHWDDLRAFECIFVMCKLERLLVGAGAQHVKTAWLIEAFWGDGFLCGQKVASGLPNFLLLERVHASGGVPFLVIPYGLDFDKDECCSIAGDNVEFSAMVCVVTGYDFITFAQQIRNGLRFDEVPFAFVL